MRTETIRYDDDIVRKFVVVTLVWGAVGMLVGLWIALQLAAPTLNFGPYFTFGRLRPLHTNAVIFAFAGNAIFAAVYYSSQRLLKARMFSDLLSRLHFWGWQAIIVAAAITLPLGYTQGKEYAELEWPIDIAIAVVWVVFAVNVFGTIARRREKHLYVAIWFYLASIITVAILHICNNLVIPSGILKSYSLYSGVEDAFMQWWYGHNAVAFVLTTPFLGLMYYFLPKAAGRPVYSYRLSILHFWALIFIYIWAGPHHLHYTALPAWASTLGMVFSVMLWMPSWGGMLNGLLTLRGAWDKVAEDIVLKFFVVGLTFYGMSTFEGPMMSVKSVNALSHYTSWNIAHVHGGALGWVGFMTFGMIYWLLPRLFQTELYSRKLAVAHFWTGTVGIVIYMISMWTAGLMEGLMWRAFDRTGRLMFPDFLETTSRLFPMNWARAFGGGLYLVGLGLMGWNVYQTWRRRPAQYAEVEATVTIAEPEARALAPAVPHPAMWHHRWEGMPVVFTVLTALAIIVASLFEIIPTFVIGDNVPKIASVKPYTPLELYGRDIYLREGCYNCHSQMVRPFVDEVVRYGEYSKPGEFVYDHPFQWGSRRIGPDLHREGGKRTHLWHLRHFESPPSTSPGTVMPDYPHLLVDRIDWSVVQGRVDTMAMLGVPYGAELSSAVTLAETQAQHIAAELEEQGGPADLDDREVIALIAYMQRIGTDIQVPAAEASDMSMTELVSALSPSTFTQIATVLFVAVFATQSVRALSRRMRAAHAEASALPLADDDRPGAPVMITQVPDPQFEDRPLAHDYDGIDEYDNPAPFWLTRTFYATIVFAVGYVAYYHLGGPGVSERQEFATAWAAHQQVRSAAAATERIAVSEDIFVQLAASPTRLETGRAIFLKNCQSCHTDNGRGLVGPNLTDEYQIHGAGRMDIYHTIRDGVPPKGMIAWGEVLPYDDLLSVASYVVSLRGTNVPDGKPPEGQRVATK